MSTTPAHKLRHDLLTCLNQVLGYAEMLLDDAPKDPERLRDIATDSRALVLVVQNTDPQDIGAASEQLLRSIEDRLNPLLNADGIGADAKRIEAALSSFRSLATQRNNEPEHAAVAPQADDEHAAGGLLLVDDNEQNLDLLKRQLERQGYTVRTASSGSRALDALKSGDFDLVLLDVLMPDMNGIEVLRRMKAEGATREIPVIMISALDEYRSVVECIESGAEDFLPKPVDPVLLRARLKASLEKKALRDAQQRERQELARANDELRRAQEKLVTQEKLASLGVLTAGIAHEIKNPLNFITNFARVSRELAAELLESLPEMDPAQMELWTGLQTSIQKIEEHGIRADRIIRGMLMHSRGETGTRQKIEVNSFVNDCVNLAYHGARAQDGGLQISISRTFDDSLGSADVFAQDLSRVVVNIVQNAYYSLRSKHAALGSTFSPEINVTTRNVSRDCFEICVQDNGPGMAPAVQKRIFEPFFTTRAPGEGTGLGLSISYDIVVREHEGKLAVDSKEGEGAQFVITLPKSGAAKCP